MSSALQYHYLGSTRDLCSVLNDIFGGGIVQNLGLGTLQTLFEEEYLYRYRGNDQGRRREGGMCGYGQCWRVGEILVFGKKK